MSLGVLDIPCPSCGEILHIEIDGAVVGGDGMLSIRIEPIIPDHYCPPPPAREPIATAA